MKRLALLFVFCGMLMTAMADWTYGTAYFQGSQPSNCLNHGGVMIWYDGNLRQTGHTDIASSFPYLYASVEAYPKNYNGPQMRFTSKGGTVQIQTLR